MILWIDPTNVCNFKCVFCPTGDDELLASVGRPKGFMSMETFDKVVDDLAHMVDKYGQRPMQISLYKDGEPLLNKSLPEMIGKLKERNLTDSLEITTNGAAMTAKWAEALVKSGLNKIRFSIEHVTDKGYEDITQKKVSAERIAENIRRFWEVNKAHGEPIEVYAKIIDVDLTDEERQLFHDTYEDISHIKTVDVLHGWSASEKSDFKLGQTHETNALGLPFVNKKVCSQPFTRATILFDGDVTPCCVDWSHKLVVGNVMEESLDTLWNVNANELRIAHLTHTLDESSPCYNCGYAQGIQDYELLDGEESRLMPMYGGEVREAS